jgi:hypothetical protein
MRALTRGRQGQVYEWQRVWQTRADMTSTFPAHRAVAFEFVEWLKDVPVSILLCVRPRVRAQAGRERGRDGRLFCRRIMLVVLPWRLGFLRHRLRERDSARAAVEVRDKFFVQRTVA